VTCDSFPDLAWATATLTDNSTGVATTPLQPTCVNGSGWTPVVVPVIAGDSYTLTLTSHGDGIVNVYTLFDDVALAPAGPDPVVNGGFESGTFSGWTANGAAAGGPGQSSTAAGGPGQSGAATSIVSSGQHSGSYAAQAGSPDGSNGGSSIVQTFTAARGDSGLALWYDATCGSFNFGTDGATATLTDNTAGTSSTVFGPDCPIGEQGRIQVNAPIIAGHSYTLTLTNTDTSNSSYFPTYTLFDDIGLY